AAECPILLAISGNRVHRQDDEVFWRQDGSSIPVEYLITPIHKDDLVVGAVIAFRDITDRRLAIESRCLLEEHAQELARMTQAMSQMNRELDQFAYVASHDLKAPLRGIASLSSWIEDDLRPQLS